PRQTAVAGDGHRGRLGADLDLVALDGAALRVEPDQVALVRSTEREQIVAVHQQIGHVRQRRGAGQLDGGVTFVRAVGQRERAPVEAVEARGAEVAHPYLAWTTGDVRRLETRRWRCLAERRVRGRIDLDHRAS